MPERGGTPDPVQAGLDRVPCGYLATDAAGRIVEVNEVLLGWLGYGVEDLVGARSFTDLLTGGGKIYHETHYRPTLELHGEAREIAVDLRCADGTRIPVLLSSVLDGPDEVEPGTVRTAVFKATERRRYEQELLVARRRAEASEAEALAIARTLQRTLIPLAPATISGGLALDVAFRPAGDGGVIGGDFYDVFELASGDWIVVVGDVCGKGVEAAALAALVRQLVRAEAVHASGLDRLLQAVNAALLDRGDDRYCTALVARVTGSGPRRRVSLCAGGHPLALVRTAGGGLTEVGRHSSLVGLFEAAVYREDSIDLGPGDLLVLYTDGVTEARRGSELFGEQRLGDLVVGSDAGDLAHVVVEAVLEFQDGFAADDIAVITLAMPVHPV